MTKREIVTTGEVVEEAKGSADLKNCKHPQGFKPLGLRFVCPFCGISSLEFNQAAGAATEEAPAPAQPEPAPEAPKSGSRSSAADSIESLFGQARQAYARHEATTQVAPGEEEPANAFQAAERNVKRMGRLGWDLLTMGADD